MQYYMGVYVGLGLAAIGNRFVRGLALVFATLSASQVRTSLRPVCVQVCLHAYFGPAAGQIAAPLQLLSSCLALVKVLFVWK